MGKGVLKDVQVDDAVFVHIVKRGPMLPSRRQGDDPPVGLRTADICRGLCDQDGGHGAVPIDLEARTVDAPMIGFRTRQAQDGNRPGIEGVDVKKRIAAGAECRDRLVRLKHGADIA